MNRSNLVAETKALISFTVTASLFSHMQKKRLFRDGTPLIVFTNSNIRKTVTTILECYHFST